MELRKDNILPKIISPKGENKGHFQQSGQNEQKFMYEFSYTKENTATGQGHVINLFFPTCTFLFVGFFK